MSNLTGTDKSVILLMTIGEDRAAEVFKHLSQREVQTLSAAMANVTQISNKQLTDVLAEFEQEAEQFAALNINANDYLRSVLVKALGEERAASLLEDILETRDTASGIETLNFMEPQSAADLIRDEHPQIIATILVHLKRAQAADILALFDERLRHDVMLRIATFGGVQPVAACRRYSARRSRQPWSGASVAGGKRTESDSADCAPPCRNWRDGNWQRRGYLCLIICRGKPGRRTISRHHRQSLCP